jgi:predicted patatin/cPLA2 family phospholipase
MTSPVNDLCIGGGSFKGLSFLGALEYITKTQNLDLVNFHGCSIGSIIGIFYIIGVKPLDMLDYLLDLNFKDYWDFDIKKIQESYSVLSGKIFIYFEELFKKYEDVDINFEQFYDKYKVNINILTVCLSTKQKVVFSNTTHPKTRLFDVLKASCSIPIMFPPVEIDKEYYIDGCTKNIYGCTDDYINGYTIVLKKQEMEINDIYSYSAELMYTLTSCDKPKSKYLIEIENYDRKFNFDDINYNYKVKLYYSGIKQTEKILNQ